MSIETRIHQYDTVFRDWKVGTVIGRKSDGSCVVFSLVRENYGFADSCALKVMNLISRSGNYEQLTAEQRSEYEKEREYRARTGMLEVRLMEKLRGNTHIVDYLDYSIENWREETSFGCDLLIRMELLHDLRKELLQDHKYDNRQVIQIGRDICEALILCGNQEEPIVHRDIKPDNIFFNKNGDYKLGDFGISRILDVASGGLATTVGIGTKAYVPPEQFRLGSEGCDQRADIYSLGLTLYELCNDNKLPFAESKYIRDRDAQMRLLGNPLPPPQNAGPALASVLLKACAYEPEDRYQSVQQFLDALNQADTAGDSRAAAVSSDSFADAKTGRSMPVPDGAEETTVLPFAGQNAVRQQSAAAPASPRRQTNTGLYWLIGAAIILILTVILIGVGLLADGEDDIDRSISVSGSSGAATDSEPVSEKEITPSTVQRKPLAAGAVTETAYYTDETGFIKDENRLLDGMKKFYELTGVQPYLYLTDSVNGKKDSSDSELERFAGEKYDALFSDAAHFLVVSREDDEYFYGFTYVLGIEAEDVLDDEALQIFEDYFDYYVDGTMTQEEFYSTVFEKTAERMMTVTQSG